MAEHRHPRQARRSFLGTAAAASLALLMAGCRMIPGDDRPRPPVEPEPLPMPTPTPGPAPEEERNKVAVLVPLSGENAGIGTSISNAANLALLDTGGREIRITVYDTARGAQAAAAQAVSEGNGLILGPLLAEDVRAVAPVARQARVPVIAFSNDVRVAGNGVYLMGFDPVQSIERVVGHARTQNMQRFAGLAPEGDYGRRSGQALIAAVEGGGGRMVAMETYGETSQSLR
ncbi:MAG TPA: penicillin-binding protein activator, partial [Allosphingosinicella sp.]